jgi:hypothetical protein
MFIDASTSPALYTAAPPPSPRDDMMTIINQWSIATGRDMKARTVAPSPRTTGTRNGASVPVGAR